MEALGTAKPKRLNNTGKWGQEGEEENKGGRDTPTEKKIKKKIIRYTYTEKLHRLTKKQNTSIVVLL